jgi:parallel beta-helix repeat protein
VITTQNFAHLWLEGNIDASAYSYGVAMDARFSMLRNLQVDNGGSGGLILTGAVNNTLIGVTANNNTGTGVTLLNGMNNTLKDVTASNNSSYGVSLGGSKNIINSMRANNNGVNGVYLNLASNNTLTDVIASNNGTGVNLTNSSNNILTDVTSSNNATGVNLSSSNNNIITSMTVSNNSGMGVTLFPASYNTIAGVTASNNNLGVYLRTASYNTFADVASSNNATGVYLYSSSYNTFNGLLKIGSNGSTGSSNCTVSGGTLPGLATGTCSANNDSTITLANSFVGKVTGDDGANASDASGTAGFSATPATFDWGHFDNKYRGWGIDGSALFPNLDQRGKWTTLSGRIWDWSLLASDVVNRGVLSLPTGDNTMTHTWNDASSTTFLRNAMEIAADGIGNDNGLCESGEACQFTPNIGSYQGSGGLVSAGTFTNGSLAGITLMKYATNGEAAQP